MKPDRLSFFISLVAMILIWVFVTSLLGEAMHRWKGDWQHTFVHLLAVATLLALWFLIPVQIVQSVRKQIRQRDEEN